MTIDLSLDNSNIKAFFSGKSQDPPTAEFMYTHTHRIRGNFVEQIEKLILSSVHVFSEPKHYMSREKLLRLTIQLGQQVENIDEKNAPAILHTLRQIYQLCKNVTGSAQP